jgi:hypothetical protein
MIKKAVSEQWLTNTNRGGLYRITDTAFDFFLEMELFTQNSLLTMDTSELCKQACTNPAILQSWAECMVNSNDVDMQSSLLEDTVKTWIKMRGHSQVDSIIELHKKKFAKVAKKKSLQKELARQSNQSLTNK